MDAQAFAASTGATAAQMEDLDAFRARLIEANAVMNLVGPDTLTGADAAAIWSEALGRPVSYAGDDTAGFEQNLRQFMPSWMAYDMRQMAGRFQSDGMIPEAGDVARLTALLGRPLRSYRDYVAQITA